MQTIVGKMARYKKIQGSDGNRYRFYCDITGALLCTSDPVILSTPEQEVLFAWESEGKKHFNLCSNCGRWVSDMAYNVETLECVECSPWEEEPSFCPHCGAKVQENEVFCTKCKNRLWYGKTDSGMK